MADEGKSAAVLVGMCTALTVLVTSSQLNVLNDDNKPRPHYIIMLVATFDCCAHVIFLHSSYSLEVDILLHL